jgi:hypothetical protein
LTKFVLTILFILAGCNVANQPATLSEGSGVGGDSRAQIGFSAGSSSRSESSAIVSIPYSFTEAPTSPTNITFSYSGTATGGPACLPGVDYIFPVTPTFFPAGIFSGILEIAICNDGTYEGNESLIVSVASTTPAVGLTSIGTHVVTLIDSLSPPTISFTSASSGSIGEGAAGLTNIPVSIQLSHPTTQLVSFQTSIAGSATLLNDYTLSATSFAILPGDTTAILTVTVFGDNTIEPNENIVLGLFAPSNASIGLQPTHEIQIAQDEVPATIVANVAPPVMVQESVGTTNVTINLAGVSDQPTTLNFAVDFASAIAASRRATYPDDFSLVNVNGNCSLGTHSVVTSGLTGTITICPGQTSVTVPVSITNDALYEPTEGIILRLTGGPLVSVGGFPAGELIIDESDVGNKPIISFQSPGQSLVESNTAGGITLRLQDPLNPALDRASGEDVSLTLTPVNVSTSASDWALGTTTVTIPAGQTRVTIPITVLQDGVDEDNELLNVNLSTLMTYSLGISTHAVTIVDNDAASRVSFQLVSQSVAEAPAVPLPLVVNVVLDRPSQRILTVNYSVTGSVTSTTGACGGNPDISASGTLVIPAGTTLIPLGILNCPDQSYEGNETARFTITSVTNGALGTSLVHTASIIDDEALPIISLTANNNSPSENSGNIELTATITNAPITAQTAMVIPVSFAGTAVRGVHYDYLGTSITIPAGQNSGTLSVSLMNNNLYGGEKNFTATMGTGFWQLGIASQVITITDDEVVPQIGFTTPAVTVAESVGAHTVTLRVNPGFPACEGPMSLGLSRSGTATFGQDHDFLHPTTGISAGATSTNLNYNIINDNMHEPGAAETLVVTVTSAICNGVNLLLLQPASPAAITVSITDDDPQPVIGYDVTTKTFMENAAGPNTITIRLDRPSSQPINIVSTLVANTPVPADNTNPTDPEFFEATTNAVPSQDISVATTAFIIPAGQTSVTQTLNIINDSDFEYTERATFILSGQVNATLSSTADETTVNIADDDVRPFAHLSFVNNPAGLTTARSVIETNVAAQNVFALLSNNASNGGAAVTAVVPVIVNLSIQGTATNVVDYTLGGVTGSAVVVPAGASFINFSLTHVDDALLENIETIRFATASLINAQISSSNSQITHSISLDADLPPVVTVTPNPAIIAESGGLATFTVTVQPVGKAITLDYTIAGTAIAGLDHSLESGSLSVLPSTGVQNFPLAFTIINDNIPEPDETIDISLVANPPGDANTAGATSSIIIEVSDYLQLANGNTHTCGLLGGQVKCWGEVQYLGYAGQAIEIVADGSYGVSANETVASLPYVQLGTGFVPTKIAANTNSTCAMSSTGSVKCWGSNADGRLGQSLAPLGANSVIGDAANEMGDNLIAINLGNPAVDITVGNRHACALLNTGRIKCWGYNGYGQLGVARTGVDCSTVGNTFCIGDGPGEMAALQVVSFPEAGTVVQVVAGYNTTCALLTTGRIYCFGENTNGQLGQDKADAMYGETAGDMTNAASFRPVQFNALFASLPVVGMAAGNRANCAVFLNGVNMETLCWGDGTGTDITPLSTVTTEVDYFGLGSFDSLRSITASSQNVCVRGDTNQVFCWGSDTNGKLGNGGADVDTDDFIGQDLDGAALTPGSFLNLATAANHSCAAVAVNQFRCWGLNSSGQFGNESAASASTPTAPIDFD